VAIRVPFLARGAIGFLRLFFFIMRLDYFLFAICQARLKFIVQSYRNRSRPLHEQEDASIFRKTMFPFCTPITLKARITSFVKVCFLKNVHCHLTPALIVPPGPAAEQSMNRTFRRGSCGDR
jgi:hypothetical protein